MNRSIRSLISLLSPEDAVESIDARHPWFYAPALAAKGIGGVNIMLWMAISTGLPIFFAIL